MSRADLFKQKLVVFGGGTGLSNLLRGLIQVNDPALITAVPSAWDDGGSTGRLRDEMGSLPPGDIRQCLLACMEDLEQKQIAQRLFDDRLADLAGPFKGHSVGNLITARLEKLYNGLDRGIEAARLLFRIRVNILPATLTEIRLIAKLKSGKEVLGETNIDKRGEKDKFDPEDRIVRIYFNTRPTGNNAIIEAIKKSDKIIFSAGDLYTSILPHLLIPGIKEAILKSRAKLIFVLNLMTKKGETDNFLASDHLEAFLDYLEDKKRLDYMIINNKTLPKKELEIYRNDGQEIVQVDEKKCIELSPKLRIISKPMIKYLKQAHLLRHDSIVLAKTIIDI